MGEEIPTCEDGLKPIGLARGLICPQLLNPNEVEDVIYQILTTRNCVGFIDSNRIQEVIKKTFGVEIDLDYVSLSGNFDEFRKDAKTIGDLVWVAMHPEDAS